MVFDKNDIINAISGNIDMENKIDLYLEKMGHI